MKKIKKEKTVLGLTKEQAKIRKEELFEILNKYSADILNDVDPGINDEEIDKLRDEYEVLLDFVGLSEEEQIYIMDDENVVENPDGTFSKRKSALDHINIFAIIFGLILIVFASGIVTENVMRLVTQSFLKAKYTAAIKGGLTTSDSFLESKYCYKAAGLYATSFFGCILVPLITTVLSALVFVYYYFKQRRLPKKERVNTYVALGVLIICFILSVVTVILIYTKFVPLLEYYIIDPDTMFEVYSSYKEIIFLPVD